MAIKRFRGLSIVAADTWTFTVNTFSNNTVIGVSCNGKTVTRACGAGETGATAAAALQLLLAASPIPEFQEYTWTANGAVIQATAKQAGIPGTFAAAGASNAVAASNTTPGTSPNTLNATNFGGSLPAEGDTVIFDAHSPSALYGLDSLDEVGPITIVMENFGGSIGLPVVTSSGSSFSPSTVPGYVQYRRTHLLLGAGAVVVEIGRGSTAPSRVMLELGVDCDATVNVYGTGQTPPGELAVVQIHGTTGHAALNVNRGTVGLALMAGQTGGFDTIRVGGDGENNDNTLVTIGAGATVPELINQSGRSVSAASVSNLVMKPTAVSHQQTSGTLSAVVEGGRLSHESAGNLTVTARGSRSVVDLAKDVRPKSLSGSCAFTNGAILVDPAGTWAAGTATFDAASLKASLLGQGATVARN
jgi:hypothetical protein